MSNRRWTVLLVPHGSRGSRGFDISGRALRVLVGVCTVLTVAGVAFAYTTVTRAVHLARLDQLETTNRLLTQELEQTRTILEQVNDTLAVIAQRDQEVRLLAGLEPTDADVQLAGIGGPGGPWTDRERILAQSPTGLAALGMRQDVGSYLRRATFLAGSVGEALDSMSSIHDRLARTPSIMPTHGFLSSRFASSRIHPIFHEARPHEGIDISAPANTPILATAGGIIVDVDANVPGYGKMVTIDHGYGVVTRYAHCSRILVRVGQRVRRGDEVALVGSTGIATAPHLHYEVLVSGRQVDPKQFIFPESIVD